MQEIFDRLDLLKQENNQKIAACQAAIESYQAYLDAENAKIAQFEADNLLIDQGIALLQSIPE